MSCGERSASASAGGKQPAGDRNESECYRFSLALDLTALAIFDYV